MKEWIDQTLFIWKSHGPFVSVFVRPALYRVVFGQPIGQQILNHPLLRKMGEIGRSHVSPAAGDGAHGAEHLAHSDFVKSRNVTREGRK